VFDAFDVNKNGVLEAHELWPVARELGYRLPREQLDDILRSFDLDAHGILTFDEFLEAMPGNYDLIPEDEHRRAEIRHKFQEFDRDCNGYISREEAYGVLFRELGFDREKSNSLINQFDINADGQLSYEEFIGFYMKVRERKDAIDVAFRQFDRDNKGYVSMGDAKRILKGQLFSDAEVEAIVRAHDTNHDGKLQYEEFVHFWTA
jgi:Ca2+-binding EF-hand superfamily protein